MVLLGPLNIGGEPLSYPFGKPRNAVSRPDLNELRRACLLVGGIEVKVLALYRDPLATTYSRVHQMRNELATHALLQVVDCCSLFVC
jgi:hypothetical protein